MLRIVVLDAFALGLLRACLGFTDKMLDIYKIYLDDFRFFQQDFPSSCNASWIAKRIEIQEEIVKVYDRNFLESAYFPRSIITFVSKNRAYTFIQEQKRNVPKNDDSRFMEIVLSTWKRFNKNQKEIREIHFDINCFVRFDRQHIHIYICLYSFVYT